MLRTTKPHKTWVTVGGSRGEQWTSVLGTATLPVRSLDTHGASIPFAEYGLYYLLAEDAITDRDFRVIILHLVATWRVSEGAVAAKVHRFGIPIMAEDCVPFHFQAHNEGGCHHEGP